MSSVFFAVLLALVAESINEGSHDALIETSVKLSTGYVQMMDTGYRATPSLDLAIPWNESYYERLSTLPFKAGYIPRIQNFVLAAGPRKTSGALIQGIIPDAENDFNALSSKIIKGSLFDQKGGAVLGRELAEYLQVQVGDTVVVIGQGYQGTLASGKYHVAGVVKLSVKELNKITFFLPLEEAQRLFDMPGLVTQVLVNPENPEQAPELASAIRTKFQSEGITALTWEEMLPELLQALAFDTISNRVLLAILYVVVGFGIFGTVLTMTLERTREFGMLISIGMKRKLLALTTVVETLLLGLSGVLLGVAVGFPILLYMHFHPIPLGGDLQAIADDFGIEPMLYFSIKPVIFLVQGLVILLISSLIAIYPYRFVMKLNFLKAARGD
ncbi:ABC transporter permease [Thermaurantimonas sp.]|uniref:ABC transporter permease n=1 Tax=Thermaurantimonas sp. TaxID=2681568 RepID=UPI00391DE761